MPQRVTLGELLVGGAVLVVAVVAEVSLALADGRAWTLPLNALVAVLLLAVAGVLLVRRRPALDVAPRQLVVVGAIGIATAVLVVPGFPVGMAGWDPGIYTNHALAIARTGDYDMHDPVLDVAPELPGTTLSARSNARFPGTNVSTSGDRTVAGFYHLYPALMAPAADLAGERGAIDVNPLLGVLVTMVLALLAWRAFGAWAGGIAGAVAATNMIQVWHARYPTSEVLTELLLVGALLGVLVARDTGWRAAAGVAGVLTGLIFLARGDGFLIVLLAVAGLALLAATGRFDARATWFACGLALVLPHALLQAYRFADLYTASQGVPGKVTLLGAIAILAAGGVLAWRLRAGPVGRVVDSTTAWIGEHRRAVGIALVAGFSLMILAAYLRPLWVTHVPDDSVLGGSVSYYNARAMERLTWFFTPLGISALWLGFAVLSLRRWSFGRWVVVLPSLAVLPIYLADARIAPRLMWWTRRFVSYALPGMFLLVAVGVAYLVCDRRIVVRVIGAVAGLTIVGAFLAQSLPLRGHDELAGSFLVNHAVDDAAGGRPATWLWATGPTPAGINQSAPAFASTMLYREGDPVAILDPKHLPAAVDDYRTAFPDQPLFVVADGRDLPAELANLDVEKVKEIAVNLPLWELTYTRPPDEAAPMPFVFSVYRLRGT